MATATTTTTSTITDYKRSPEKESILTTTERKPNVRRQKIKLSTDPKSTVESYYYARTSKAQNTSLSLQVQRLHKNSHPEAIFNINQGSTRRVTGRGKNTETISIPNLSTELIYDGTHAPIADKETLIYQAYLYDSQSSQDEIAQFSRYGVFFSPKTTPILLPDMTIRTSRATSYGSSQTSKDATGSTGPRRTGSMTEAAGANILCQPVSWILAPDGSGYKVIDQPTGMTVGKWTCKKLHSSSASSPSTESPKSIMTPTEFTKRPQQQQWCFISKTEVLAVLDNGSLRIHKIPENLSFVDDVARRLRKKYRHKHSNNGAAGNSSANNGTSHHSEEVSAMLATAGRSRSSSFGSNHSGSISPESGTGSFSSAAGNLGHQASKKFRSSISSISSIGGVIRSNSASKRSSFPGMKRSNSGNNCITAGTGASENAYRARFVDGIMFTSMSLLLALDAGNDTSSSRKTSEELKQTSQSHEKQALDTSQPTSCFPDKTKKKSRRSMVTNFKSLFKVSTKN